MNLKKIVLNVPSDVAKEFDNFIKENKAVFGNRANLMRMVLANINLLANTNSKIVDPEKKELRKENEQLRLKLVEYEAEIYALKNSQVGIQEFNQEVLNSLDLIPEMFQKINSLEKILMPESVSESNIFKNKHIESGQDIPKESIFKSPKIR